MFNQINAVAQFSSKRLYVVDDNGDNRSAIERALGEYGQQRGLKGYRPVIVDSGKQLVGMTMDFDPTDVALLDFELPDYIFTSSQIKALKGTYTPPDDRTLFDKVRVCGLDVAARIQERLKKRFNPNKIFPITSWKDEFTEKEPYANFIGFVQEIQNKKGLSHEEMVELWTEGLAYRFKKGSKYKPLASKKYFSHKGELVRNNSASKTKFFGFLDTVTKK